ncbi:MAG: hypothetical protein DLM58_22330 [Pseudonocardiales bacterium]|nr:MAG: hypothetical protein DLM58_22330 [Pseudonocardiales bacterium]
MIRDGRNGVSDHADASPTKLRDAAVSLAGQSPAAASSREHPVLTLDVQTYNLDLGADLSA